MVAQLIGAVDKQLMKVDIEIETPSESLDQGNRASFGFWLWKIRFLSVIGRDGGVSDVESFGHDLGSDGKAEPNGEWETDYPLTNGF